MYCRIQLLLEIDGEDDTLETVANFDTECYRVARATYETIKILLVPTHADLVDYLKTFEEWQKSYEERENV